MARSSATDKPTKQRAPKATKTDDLPAPDFEPPAEDEPDNWYRVLPLIGMQVNEVLSAGAELVKDTATPAEADVVAFEERYGAKWADVRPHVLHYLDTGERPVHRGRHVPEHQFDRRHDRYVTGGVSMGEGFTIAWQNGVEAPNGAILEDVLAACAARLSAFQDSPSACMENARSIVLLDQILELQRQRTQRRKQTGELGTYAGH